MINAIALDDEPPSLKVLESFCNKVDFVTLQKTFSKPNDALKHIQKFPVDLLFLDIQMPSISGIDFYKYLNQDVMVVFITAHSQYAVEGFNLNAVDYLLKPFTFDRFLQALNKVQEYSNFQKQNDKPAQNYILVRANYSLVKIFIPDILFIEGLDDYLKIHITGKNPLVVRMTMKTIIEKLPAKEFIRVHRSFIVPLKKIEAVRIKMILLSGEEIPIGSSYEEAFFQFFKIE